MCFYVHAYVFDFPVFCVWNRVCLFLIWIFSCLAQFVGNGILLLTGQLVIFVRNPQNIGVYVFLSISGLFILPTHFYIYPYVIMPCLDYCNVNPPTCS